MGKGDWLLYHDEIWGGKGPDLGRQWTHQGHNVSCLIDLSKNMQQCSSIRPICEADNSPSTSTLCLSCQMVKGTKTSNTQRKTQRTKPNLINYQSHVTSSAMSFQDFSSPWPWSPVSQVIVELWTAYSPSSYKSLPRCSSFSNLFCASISATCAHCFLVLSWGNSTWCCLAFCGVLSGFLQLFFEVACFAWKSIQKSLRTPMCTSFTQARCTVEPLTKHLQQTHINMSDKCNDTC